MNMNMDMNLNGEMSAGMNMNSQPSGMTGMESSSTTMNMNMGSGMVMQGMSFFSSTSTNLYITMWTPTNLFEYAATCIFLISLAIASKGLVAMKSRLESHWSDMELYRKYGTSSGRLSTVEDGSDMESKFKGIQQRGVESRPWRPTVEPIRAVIDTVMSGIGFLLMLAVMTMNIGYFLSVLGGIFLGSLIFGRLSSRHST